MSTEAVEGADSHLSIGEVLEELRGQFPDITISKIRFLESQGLIDPERTPSGYRRFYSPDLERLRWILFQQRDHFLPLRVIKDRLDAFGPTGAPRMSSSNGGGQAAPLAPTPEPRPTPPTATATPTPASPTAAAALSPTPRPSPPAAPSPPRPSAPTEARRPIVELAEDVDTEDDEERFGAVHAAPDTASSTDLTRAELLEATGLTDSQLDALESFGMVSPVADDEGRARYDDESLAIAELAAGCYRRGIEARHLKMYWHFAEREAALFTQVLMPYVRQRNPAARAKLQGELEELTRLGRRLRTAMLRRALRATLAE